MDPSEELNGSRGKWGRAIRVDPSHVNSMVNLGVVLGNNNDFNEAIPIYRRALAIQPKAPPSLHSCSPALPHPLTRPLCYAPALDTV